MNIRNFSIFRCVQNYARQPISRVLSFKLVICLGLNSHLTSSNQPRQLTKNCFRPKAMPSLFGLAPGGVFHAFFVTKKPVRSYRTFSPLPRSGGLFSVALSLRFPSPEVIWHRVLIEPGLSSLVYSTKATNQLSGNRLNKQKKTLNQGFFIAFLIYFEQ